MRACLCVCVCVCVACVNVWVDAGDAGLEALDGPSEPGVDSDLT